MSDIEPRNAFEGIQSATILKPGDRVLLVVAGWWDMERLHNAQHDMSDRFPEVEFTFVSGVGDVVVAPAEVLGTTEANG